MLHEHNRFLWFTTLEKKFYEALTLSTEKFSWQEKADFIELLVKYIQIVKRNDETSTDDAHSFYNEHFLKAYKSKLKPATDAKLFKFFWRELAFVEFGVISLELFNHLPAGEQGMTVQEFDLYLSHLLLGLGNLHNKLYIYESDAGETQDDTFPFSGVVKGRSMRIAGDNMTKLNQEQTVLLIHHLQRGRVILKDEYLTDKAAGQAFSMLTGYSAAALRIKLSPKEISHVQTKQNLKAVHDALTLILTHIEADIRAHKGT